MMFMFLNVRNITGKSNIFIRENVYIICIQSVLAPGYEKGICCSEWGSKDTFKTMSFIFPCHQFQSSDLIPLDIDDDN